MILPIEVQPRDIEFYDLTGIAPVFCWFKTVNIALNLSYVSSDLDSIFFFIDDPKGWQGHGGPIEFEIAN